MVAQRRPTNNRPLRYHLPKSMSESQGVPQQRYRVAMYGGGIEELDRFGIRDLIRRGDVSAQTELALAGSEEWKTAASYPELARYFNIISARPSATPGPVVGSKPRVVHPMSERIIGGLLYPLAGGEVLMLIGLAILGFIP